MVFYVRTRRGYDELVEFLGKVPSPLWIDRDVLNDEEIARLRDAGLSVTNFFDAPSAEGECDMIRRHHEDEVLWVEDLLN